MNIDRSQRSNARLRLPLPRLFGLIALSFGLTLVTSCLDPAILGHKVLLLGMDNSAMTYGILTFAGLTVAGLVQPIAGWLSDRVHSRGAARTPFLIGGALVATVGLAFIASASSFVAILGSLLLLQVGFNTVQSPWQSLIPAYVPIQQRGFAAGVKAMYDLLAAIVGRLAAGALMAQQPNWGQWALWLTVLVAVLGLLSTLVTTLLSVRLLAHAEEPIPIPAASTHGIMVVDVATRLRQFIQHLPNGFRRWFINRLCFWCAFIASSTFLLFVAIDVLGMTESVAQAYIGRLTAILGAALLLVILPAGWLTDRVGRAPLIVTGGVLAGLGTFGVAMTRDLNLIVACAMLIGVGVGFYLSGSVALLTDIVPTRQAAQYLGLANLATAGGSAIARLVGGILINTINTATHTRSVGYVTVYAISAVLFLLSAGLMGRGPIAPIARPPSRREQVEVQHQTTG